MSSRRIVIDDTSSLIHYSEGWASAAGNDTDDTFGKAYQGDEHVTFGIHNLSFSFSGTFVQVFGSNHQIPNAGADNSFDPKWDCVVDGSIGLRTSMGSKNFGYNLELCVSDTLQDGDHNLTVRANSHGAPFAVDRIMYSPSVQSGAKTDVLWVGSDDPAFVYVGNWTTGNDDTQLTNVVGSTVSFTFTGTKLTWFGTFPGDFGHDNTTCLGAIDGGNPLRVPLKGLPSGDNRTRTDQVLFVTPNLNPGNHTVTLTYDQGSVTSTSPLSITYVLVANADISPFLASPTGDQTSATLKTPQQTQAVVSAAPKSSHHVPTGALAGGLIGGILCVLLLLLLTFFVSRRRRRHKSPSELHWSTSFLTRRFSHRYSRTLPILVTRSTLVTTDDGHARRSSEPLVGDPNSSDISNNWVFLGRSMESEKYQGEF